MIHFFAIQRSIVVHYLRSRFSYFTCFFLFVRVFIIWYQIMCTLFVKRFGCHKNLIYQTMQQFCATTIQATMSQSYLNFAHTFHTQMPTLMSFTIYTSSSTCRQRRQVIMEFKFVKIYLVFHFSNSFEKNNRTNKNVAYKCIGYVCSANAIPIFDSYLLSDSVDVCI